MKHYTSLEICAGAGGEAIGLEQAGFEHVALLENDRAACQTLRLNRPNWRVIEGDVTQFHAHGYRGVDLFSGGVPCQPFSEGGDQIGCFDERDLFPEAIRLVGECEPRAVLLENVKGLFNPKFKWYRDIIIKEFADMGYTGEWRLLNASDFGVPQLRPRAIFIAFKEGYWPYFTWPTKTVENYTTVGDTLFNEMGYLGWPQVHEWREQANKIAPTIVGGSKKHGGADLGPTRAKKAWAELGVDGHGLANTPPGPDFVGKPKLTVRMTALLQGFPANWEFAGKKTPAYRQVGNAFPPPVARALGEAIMAALKAKDAIDEANAKKARQERARLEKAKREQAKQDQLFLWQKEETVPKLNYEDTSLTMLAKS